MFAWLGAEILFSEVLLFTDDDSLRKLSAIAAHPAYIYKVEDIQFVER